MITSSVVLYRTKKEELDTIVDCVLNSCISTLYLIDNSPSRELENDVAGYDRNRVVYIFCGKNLGYGAAHNIAIREALKRNARYHVVLNPDILFTPDSIDKLYEFMNQNPVVGQIMPKVVYPTGEIQYLCKLIPTPVDLLFKRFLPAKLCRKRLYKFRLEFSGYNRVMNVPYLSGCFMFFRVSALKDVGLFDERFFMYPEDIDMTRRIHEKYKTMFYPDTTIVHAHAAASYVSKKMLCIHILNMIKYFNKWGWIFDKKRVRMNRECLERLKIINNVDMEPNYKIIDTRKIVDYINSFSGSAIPVEDIIQKSGADKLRVYPALFELEQSGWLEVVEREELGAPAVVRVRKDAPAWHGIKE